MAQQGTSRQHGQRDAHRYVMALDHFLRLMLSVAGGGLQFLANDKFVGEYWGKFPASVGRLVALLASSNTQRVLLMSGDVHFAETTRLDCGVTGFPLYDLTSSGMTHAWSAHRRYVLDLTLIANRRVGAAYMNLNSGEVAVTWADGKPATATFRVFGRTGQVEIEQSFDLSSLEPSRNHKIDSQTLQHLSGCLAGSLHNPAVEDACRALASDCGPGIQPLHYCWSFAGHVIVVLVLLTFIRLTAIPFLAVFARYKQNRPYRCTLVLSVIALALFIKNFAQF